MRDGDFEEFKRIEGVVDLRRLPYGMFPPKVNEDYIPDFMCGTPVMTLIQNEDLNE